MWAMWLAEVQIREICLADFQQVGVKVEPTKPLITADFVYCFRCAQPLKARATPWQEPVNNLSAQAFDDIVDGKLALPTLIVGYCWPSKIQTIVVLERQARIL